MEYPISLAVNSASFNESKTIADIGQTINRLLEMRLTTHDDNMKEARGVATSRLVPIVIWGSDDMQSLGTYASIIALSVGDLGHGRWG